MPQTKHTPELIEWHDAASAPAGWHFESEADFSIPTCYSVGFVLKETEEYLVVAPHVFFDEDKQFSGYMTIPQSAVKKRTKLKPVK